jgi:hypothetical protein
MRNLFPIAFTLSVTLLAGCDPLPVQYPPGSAQHPYPAPANPNITPTGNPSQPAPQADQTTASQRWQHAWSKALEGVAMGGSIGGPYGAGGGLILGFLTGLLTADSHFGRLNSQIHTEQQKDKQLEAAIESELERQRALEMQVANASITATPASAGQPDVKSKPAGEPVAAQTPQAAPISSTPSPASTEVALNKPAVVPASPFKNVDVRDVNGDGVPDLWIYYNPAKSGEIVRQEESTKADGRVDTWSHFKDGTLVRREVDSKGAGRPDVTYYYENDQIAREERDEMGMGQMSYRAFYEYGRLARVEKSAGGYGKPDLWIFYDTAREGEIVLREERDLNGDGAVDLWSHYEGGRLVRRDVSSAGLELLAKQDQIPTPAADLRKVAASGNQR